MNFRKKPNSRVIFHTGRGGRFHNAGYKTAKKVLRSNYFDASEAEYFGYHLYYYYKGEPFDLPATSKGWKGINPQEIKVLDGGGDEVCDYSDVLADYGTMNFDNEYDSITWKAFYLLEESDLFVMIRDLSVYEYYDGLLEAKDFDYKKGKLHRFKLFNETLLRLLFLDGKGLNLSACETAEILSDDYPTSLRGLIKCGLIEEADSESEEFTVLHKGKRYQLNWN